MILKMIIATGLHYQFHCQPMYSMFVRICRQALPQNVYYNAFSQTNFHSHNENIYVCNRNKPKISFNQGM